MDKTGIALNIFTIIAIVSGPIIALQIQRRLDHGREARNRKMWVFKTLMSFRATALDPTFVQALNLIDVEFDGKSANEKAVRDAWKVLLDHFYDLGRPEFKPDASSVEKSAQLKANLLLLMGKCLGYDFDEVQIKKGSYYPTGLGDVQQEQHAIRRGLLNILSGKGRIPVGIFEERFPAISLQPLDTADPPVKELGA